MAAWSGIVHVAFVLHVYSRAIVAWSAATHKRPSGSWAPADGAVAERPDRAPDLARSGTPQRRRVAQYTSFAFCAGSGLAIFLIPRRRTSVNCGGRLIARVQRPGPVGVEVVHTYRPRSSQVKAIFAICGMIMPWLATTPSAPVARSPPPRSRGHDPHEPICPRHHRSDEPARDQTYSEHRRITRSRTRGPAYQNRVKVRCHGTSMSRETAYLLVGADVGVRNESNTVLAENCGAVAAQQ